MRKGAMLSKEVLLDHLYGDEDEAELKLRDFVHKLRRKLSEASGEDYIETVRGLGYTLRDPAEPTAAPQRACARPSPVLPVSCTYGCSDDRRHSSNILCSSGNMTNAKP